jgi:pimeloyl-ACP methyl ester carboxylesterase
MEERLVRKTIDNNGIEIEYFVNNQVSDKSTLIISMGVWEPAARALPLISRLLGRHCIVLSYRGRGKSSTPLSGFNWHHHASDLNAVLQNEPANKPVFLAFSKGVSYMLGYLSPNPNEPHGIIIIDYPAIHSRAEEGYAQFWSTTEYNGFKMGNYVTMRALKGIETESSYREFYQELSETRCPVWLFRGTDSNSQIPSNLTDADVANYKSSIKDLRVIDFKHSGHMILDEELGKACKYIRDMLEIVDYGQDHRGITLS